MSSHFILHVTALFKKRYSDFLDAVLARHAHARPPRVQCGVGTYLDALRGGTLGALADAAALETALIRWVR